MKIPLRFKLAAWLSGGTLHTFQGRDNFGTWWSGILIATPPALKAFQKSFRKNGNIYFDTALLEPEAFFTNSICQKCGKHLRSYQLQKSHDCNFSNEEAE